MEKKLTPKELIVITGLTNGKLYKEIAAEHNISLDMVKKHSKTIFKKLNVRNRTEAAMWWSRNS